MSKIIAIGDIHGCLDQLVKLVDQLEQFPEHTRICLGDYIDRGPHSMPVIDFLMEQSKRHEWIFLKGNHEDMFLESLRNSDIGHAWSYPETYASFGLDHRANIMDLKPEHRAFFRDLRLSHETVNHFFCHAGVDPSRALNDQSNDTLLWMRDKFLNYKGDFGKIVVHGHTPIGVEWKPNRINLDSACVFGGKLTALMINEDGPKASQYLEFSVPGYPRKPTR